MSLIRLPCHLLLTPRAAGECQSVRVPNRASRRRRVDDRIINLLDLLLGWSHVIPRSRWVLVSAFRRFSTEHSCSISISIHLPGGIILAAASYSRLHRDSKGQPTRGSTLQRFPSKSSRQPRPRL
ncbi:hypothetical protein L1887_61795 [Cichorium endivia]|nr:hypothetical protein L1887_61795 [Cichorium endivia]